MSSNFSSKRTNKSKLSFFQQKDNKKLKTDVADPVAITSESSTLKGKQKADLNSMKVDGITLSTFQANTTKTTLSKTTSQGLDNSIHSPTKSSQAEEVNAIHVDKTSLSSDKNNFFQTLEEKITAAVYPHDESISNTNQTASSSVDKENSPEEETFIKIPKVTHFFVTFSNIEIEGDTN